MPKLAGLTKMAREAKKKGKGKVILDEDKFKAFQDAFNKKKKKKKKK